VLTLLGEKNHLLKVFQNKPAFEYFLAVKIQKLCSQTHVVNSKATHQLGRAFKLFGILKF